MLPDPLPSTVVLVDFSNLVKVCWAPARRSDPERCEPPRAFSRGFKEKLGTLSLGIGQDERSFLYVLDSPPNAKRKLWPGYKAERPRTIEDLVFDPFQKAQDRLRKRGCRFLRSPGREADDVIATAVLRVLEAHRSAVVVSTDQDLWQLLDPPRVRVFNPVRKRWVALADVQVSFGVRAPRHVALAQALWGDRGDGVPNAVPRMQAQLASLIEQADGDLERLLECAKSAPLSETCRKLLTAGAAQARLNLQLVALATDVEIVDG